MTTVFNESKENQPSTQDIVAGLSTPEKLIGITYGASAINTPKKRHRMNSVPLAAIPIWQPEPSNIWTKVTKDIIVSQTSNSRFCEAPSAPSETVRIGSKRKMPERQCPCKRPLLDFTKMCETSYIKINDKKGSIVVPKGIGLDILSLCEDSNNFTLRPISQIESESRLCLLDTTTPSTVNIDIELTLIQHFRFNREGLAENFNSSKTLKHFCFRKFP